MLAGRVEHGPGHSPPLRLVELTLDVGCHPLFELNQLGVRASNTIDACEDGTSGTYNTDESIEWLRIVSVNPDTDQPWKLPLTVGGRAKILVGLHAYLMGNSDPSSDFADFYYSTDTAMLLLRLLL